MTKMVPIDLIKKYMSEGHLAASSGRTCNQIWGQELEPHIVDRVYLKKGGGMFGECFEDYIKVVQLAIQLEGNFTVQMHCDFKNAWTKLSKLSRDTQSIVKL